MYLYLIWALALWCLGIGYRCMSCLLAGSNSKGVHEDALRLEYSPDIGCAVTTLTCSIMCNTLEKVRALAVGRCLGLRSIIIL